MASVKVKVRVRIRVRVRVREFAHTCMQAGLPGMRFNECGRDN